MPGWSPEIANEFIRLGSERARRFDQMQLQKLVYIAHGWHLAFFNEPLTGDRPEAWCFGPLYRRLADALEGYGLEPVDRLVVYGDFEPRNSTERRRRVARADLDSAEMDTIFMVFEDFGGFNAETLATLTQRNGTPWSQVFASGAGEFRDISHQLIRSQFVEFAKVTQTTE